MMQKENDHKKKLRFFNEAVEYFNEYEEVNGIDTCESIPSSEALFSNILRDQMLTELETLKELILSSPDSKISQLSEEEKGIFHSFVKAYSFCPICGGYNHDLKKMYFEDEFCELKKYLIKNMHSRTKKIGSMNVIMGIPCCACFEEFVKS
ncbi:MAG: hypothetical protein BAJALOKI1v1_1480004 [Promethearchaeota archaeon]|nr:MAG: hypothetical protein BAJALOKI1v1_1480004 [Candidatus Lokiarchaeota archaeon]